jgi:hypothetical protein
MAFLINNLVDAFHKMMGREPEKEVYHTSKRGSEGKTESNELVMGDGELETKRITLRWRYIRARGKKGGGDAEAGPNV